MDNSPSERRAYRGGAAGWHIGPAGKLATFEFFGADDVPPPIGGDCLQVQAGNLVIAPRTDAAITLDAGQRTLATPLQTPLTLNAGSITL